MARVLSGRRDFRHRLTSRLLGPLQVVELLAATPRRADCSGAGVPVTVPDRDALVAGPGRIAVTWLGHASALISVDGVTALVDPVLAGGIPGNRRRLTEPALAPEELPAVDVLLVSHDHYDHLDAPTLARLPRDVRVLAGLGSAPWFARRGFTDVTELDWWSSVEVGRADAEHQGEHAERGAGPSIRVEFVPAHHWSKRSPFDTCRRLWGGWVLTGPDGRAVVHAGDSGYGVFPARIGAHLRATDRDVAVALLPVGAYAPRHLLRGVHMDPEEAVRAAGDLGAPRMVPIHWGAFVLSAEPVTEPLERTRAAWSAAGRDRDDLWDLAVGETRTV